MLFLTIEKTFASQQGKKAIIINEKAVWQRHQLNVCMLAYIAQQGTKEPGSFSRMVASSQIRFNVCNVCAGLM